jgi:hypothetical protein
LRGKSRSGDQVFHAADADVAFLAAAPPIVGPASKTPRHVDVATG